MKPKKINPRQSNGNLRRKYRARYKAMGAPCSICHGALGEIRYDQESCAKNPLSFVLDEVIPVSKWEQGGFNSPREAAETWSNVAPAHWICNQRKGAQMNYKFNPTPPSERRHDIPSDGAW